MTAPATHPLAKQHLAALATVPRLTDRSDLIAYAKQLARKVMLHANDAGMLGDNGYGPAIRMTVENAARAGFDWRPILDLPVTQDADGTWQVAA